MTIKFYKKNDPHGHMSNYAQSRFFIYGRWWDWVEAAYQAQKTNVPSEYDAIWKATSANKSRLLGQEVTMRPDWNKVKYDIMKECVLAKYLQHHDLRAALLATGEEELIEDSPVDWYWGCGADGTGQNMLGKILMELRTLLRG